MLNKIMIYIIGLTFSFFISGTTHSDALAIEHEVKTVSSVLDGYYKEFDKVISSNIEKASNTAANNKKLDALKQQSGQQNLLSSYYSEYLPK